MIKLAGAEDSGITDRVTGRRVFVTTTARKSFRTANPAWAKVRNPLLNVAIANDFARAKPQEKPFRVRKDPNAIGQVRDGSGGQYVAIIDASTVKVVAVGKGGIPKLTAPAPVAMPTGVPNQQTPASTASPEFSFFLVKHAVDSVAASLQLNHDRLYAVIDLLSERTGLPVEQIVKQILADKDSDISETLSELCADDQADYLHTTENKNTHITDPIYEMQSDLPSSAFSVQVGLTGR